MSLPLKDITKHPVISHDIFIFQFDLEKKFPIFLAYFLSPHILWGHSKEERKYKLDPFLKNNTLSYKDYEGASDCDKKGRDYGYDKGHLAPLGSFKASLYAYQAQYMSNIVPQKRDLNQGPWREFEEKVRDFVKTGKEVQVLTGPIYSKEPNKLAPCWKAVQSKITELPSSFFKIVIHYSESQFSSCSIIIPQSTKRKTLVKDFEVKIEQIETQTDLDILSDFSGKKVLENCSFLLKK